MDDVCKAYSFRFTQAGVAYIVIVGIQFVIINLIIIT